MSTYEPEPCPMCGANQIKLCWSYGGVGGQMITVTAFAECEACLTVYRGAAASTAGFSIREARRRWKELPEEMAFLRKQQERDRSQTASQGETKP